MRLNLGLVAIASMACLFSGLTFAQMTIVNGASFNSSHPLAPGSFATIFGQNLCAQTAAGDLVAPGELPTRLANCSVMVNGAAAMMQYVSPGQINFIVPPGIGAGIGNVFVDNGSQTLNGSMTVGEAGPGVFAMNGMGVGEGAMLNGILWQTGPFSVMTNDEPTSVAIYATGLDLSSKPTVSIGGMPADVTWWGNAPGYAGLQQINVTLPAGVAGAGHVPVTVTSNGETSNVTFMHVLPTTSMMQGMPGWGPEMMVGENVARNHELSYMAFRPANNSVLVTDENDDVVRVISLGSNTTTATITLPAGSQAQAIVVNPAGTMAAVALSAKAAVAMVDLSNNQVTAVIGTGYYPSHVAFAGTTLLVTNSASGTVSVIDTNTRTLVQNVPVGVGPSGLAATPNLAVVANMQAASLSLIDLSTYAVSNVALPPGTRPHEVAISSAGNKALISSPVSNGLFMLDLGTRNITPVDLSASNVMGPGAIVTDGDRAYIANQMTANITVVDVAAGRILGMFNVDYGPRALAMNSPGNQLLVLAEGVGTIDTLDLSTHAITARLNGADTERQGAWTLPLVASISPSAAAAGSAITLTITGANLQGVRDLEFHITGFAGMGGGGMMGGGPGQGMGSEDANIKVSNIHVNAAGTEVTASVQVLPSAVGGARQIHLETDRGEIMGLMSGALFTVTK